MFRTHVFYYAHNIQPDDAMFTTKKKRMGYNHDLEIARRACGEVWTQLVEGRRWLYEEHEINLSKGDAIALFATGKMTSKVREVWEELPIEEDPNNYELNPFVRPVSREVGVQQRQQVVRRFYSNLDTFFANHKAWVENGKPKDNRPSPPYHTKRFSRADWLHDRMAKKDGFLELGTPRGKDPIRIEWPHPEPRQIHVIRQRGEHTLCVMYRKEDAPDLFRDREPKGTKVVGVDLNEVYLAAASDGDAFNVLVDGSELQRLRRIQNREKKSFAEKIDTKKKGSRRFWKLVNAKQKRLRELNDQITDLLHKLSTRLVEESWEAGASTLVIGDLRGIRENIEYGKDMNRRLHQWAFNRFVKMIEYKAKRYGIEVASTREAYTSQTCPRCGTAKESHKNGRSFRCSACGYKAHRDIVGAMGIRAKFKDPDGWQDGYLSGQDGRGSAVEGVRATPTEATASKGTSSGRKTGGNSPQPCRRRTTPRVIYYEPHMDCVLAPP